MKFKAIHIKSAMVALLCCSVSVWAQMTPQQYQQHQNDIGMYYQQQDSQKQQQNANAAARRRAWEAREAEVQARIAKHRATPFYMAIAFDLDNKRFHPPGGYYKKERAIEEALKHCQSANCRVVAVFANACAVLTLPHPDQVKSFDDLFFGIDVDDKRAAAKSIRMCEAKHGKGNCFYFSGKTQNGTALCTGYDYSIYGHH